MMRTIRLPLALVGGVAVAAIAFGAGFGVKAMTDSGDDTPASGRTVQTTTGFPGGGDDGAASGGGVSAGNNAPGLRNGPASIPVSQESAASMADKSILPYPGYGCTAPLPGSLSGSGISLNDFAVRMPGSGFELRSFSARGEGPCEGQTAEDVPLSVVVDTNWQHAESGIELNISQRKADKPTANLIGRGFATVWVDGYSFTLNAYPYRHYLATDEKPAPALGEPETRSSQPASQEYDEAAVQALLLQALAALAPNVAEQCYAHELQGDWGDLAGLGIGDPRGAIPSGWELTGSYIQYYEPAADGCDTPKPEGNGNVSFWANWSNGNGYLSVNVNSIYGEKDLGYGPGQFNSYSAYWHNGTRAFNVYGSNGNDGIGTEIIRAIAIALDPGFDQACFVTEVFIKEGDLAQFGLTTPTADGYELREERLVTWEPTAGCADVPEAQAGFSFYWTLGSDSNTIQVNADLSVYRATDGEGTVSGYISDQNISWQGPNGVWFNVSSYGNGGGTGAGLDALKAIALQLDPGVDFDSLESNGDVKPFAR